MGCDEEFSKYQCPLCDDRLYIEPAKSFGASDFRWKEQLVYHLYATHDIALTECVVCAVHHGCLRDAEDHFCTHNRDEIEAAVVLRFLGALT